MEKVHVMRRISSVLLLIISISSSGYAAERIYEKKSQLTCDSAKIQILTKCDDVETAGPPQCGEQTLSFIDLKTGIKITTSAYGKPYDKQFEGAGIANAWQCVKGKKQKYITLWYSTGGNCDECEWQGVLDLKGNRIVTDVNKKTTLFKKKVNFLGLSVLERYDFTAIPLRKKKLL